jgi:hypothetical protein
LSDPVTPRRYTPCHERRSYRRISIFMGGLIRMATYAQLGAKLLRDAATFFRNVGAQNEALKEQLNDNASVYNQVADLLEKNPLGVIAMSSDKDQDKANKIW